MSYSFFSEINEDILYIHKDIRSLFQFKAKIDSIYCMKKRNASFINPPIALYNIFSKKNFVPRGNSKTI